MFHWDIQMDKAWTQGARKSMRVVRPRVEMDIMEIARKAIATPSLITLFRPAIW
jgi:hypothetical protein